MELAIAKALYSYYKEIPRLPTTDYSVYVTHPLDDLNIGHLADEFRSATQQQDFGEDEKAEFVAAFVQGLTYTADTVTTGHDEYPRYPLETLVDNGGDCEDTAILLAAILHSLGYDVVLIAFPDEHSAVGVAVAGVSGTYFEHNGTQYFYLETTNTGWGIGQIPDDLKGLTANIYNMTPNPILTHDWDGMISGRSAELEITVNNLGSGPATDTYILAGFDAGDGKLWNAEESETFTLGLDESITVSLTLQAPREEHTRVVIQIIYDGNAVDESYSEWLDT